MTNSGYGFEAIMLSESGTETVTRPSWHRWLFAALASWLSAPFFAPFLWRLQLVEGADISSLLAGLLWTYFIGLPFAGVGVVVLVIVSLLAFNKLASWPWWVWALVGGCFGFASFAFIVLPGGADTGIDLSGLFFLSSGLVSGAMASIIFRAVLLFQRSTIPE